MIVSRDTYHLVYLFRYNVHHCAPMTHFHSCVLTLGSIDHFQHVFLIEIILKARKSSGCSSIRGFLLPFERTDQWMSWKRKQTILYKSTGTCTLIISEALIRLFCCTVNHTTLLCKWRYWTCYFLTLISPMNLDRRQTKRIEDSEVLKMKRQKRRQLIIAIR